MKIVRIGKKAVLPNAFSELFQVNSCSQCPVDRGWLDR